MISKKIQLLFLAVELPGIALAQHIKIITNQVGIVNGVTSGLNDENDIDFNLSYAQIHKDYDWRWAEQWMPHTAWYLLAIALHE